MRQQVKTIDRESPPHKKKRGKHRNRQWKIERRYIGDDRGDTFIGRYFARLKEWYICGAYENERGRDDAFVRFTTKGSSFGERWEYRKVDQPNEHSERSG